MSLKTRAFFQCFFQVAIALILTFLLVRLFEYYSVAAKFFVPRAYRFELAGLFYDGWACLIYCCIVLLPFFLLYLIRPGLAVVTFHVLNILLLVAYLSLLVVFSERTRPFDHEFFTRGSADSWLTTRQMLAGGGLGLYLPFLIYISLYLLLYYRLIRRIRLRSGLLTILVAICLLASAFSRFSLPVAGAFHQTAAYYLECNKFSFWINDSYRYLFGRRDTRASGINDKQLEREISFYQQNHPFEFSGTEYPLLHHNNSPDVLGSFFNLQKDPPNIVILVVEGLSRDFSGDSAYATSFTPFLDSLAGKSLTWNNFLSTAPGTFAAHPAISGSLPYGHRGFSLMNVMPDHLSLIKILRKNGYQTNFMIGFNPDFDNMGGYIRLQGTDFILSRYESKYKLMGVGTEGWSMGYPDDALFSRSFEVLDSLHKMPYLSIYHTATTHLPYLFQQQDAYGKLFDEKMKKIAVTTAIRRTLKECKKVLVTYMFSDDCIKQFFTTYAKRPEYSNTIFVITGDHHIGSFPSTGNIDDYHVPLIIYSPMLKGPKKMEAVNSHNNLAPSISALILKNYKLPYVPADVNWMGDVLDTAAAFRNEQSMAFMAWSREINDYIYKDYMLSENELYRLSPQLLMEPYSNDSIKVMMSRLLENFKLINSYVCDNNKIYPPSPDLLPGAKELLFSRTDSQLHPVFTKRMDTVLTAPFIIPRGFRYLYVDISADVLLAGEDTENQPSFRLGLANKEEGTKKYLYWTNRDIVLMANKEFVLKQWNKVATNDLFTLSDYRANEHLVFDVAVFNHRQPIDLKYKNLVLSIYGIR